MGRGRRRGGGGRRTIRALLTLGIAAQAGGCARPPGGQHENLNAVLWLQHSAEARATTRTIYAAATRALDRALADPEWSGSLEQGPDAADLPPAVIVDVDETVLDNSPYQARLIRDGEHYARASWDAWCREARARPVAGALEFCRHADSLGVRVFYLTNRRDHLREATRANLARWGFPLAEDEETVVTRSEESDKGPRRAEIAGRHRILLMVGDNLADFASIFHHRPAEERRKWVDEYAAWWGTRWFVVPNPTYGGWERAIYGDAWLDDEERLAAKHAALRYE